MTTSEALFKLNTPINNYPSKPLWEKDFQPETEEPHSAVELVRGARAGEFASQNDAAEAFGVDKGTVSRWKAKAIRSGLITPSEWERCLLTVRLARIPHPAETTA